MSRCDYPGCKGVPAVEVINFDNHCWNYLCKKHYNEELQKLENRSYGLCELTTLEQMKALTDFLWMPVLKIYWHIYYNYLYKPAEELEIGVLGDKN